MEKITEQMTDVEAPSITPEGWSNAPTLRQLKQDYSDARPAHDDQRQKIQRWLDYLHVEGQAKPKDVKGHSQAQPKLIRKQAEWRYAALSEPFLTADNLFNVKPATWEDTEAARQNALVLNKQFNTDIDKVSFIDEFVRAAEDEGTAIVKLSWITEEEEVTEMVPEVEWIEEEEMLPLLEEVAAMKDENPTGFLTEVPEELRIAVDRFIDDGFVGIANITGYTEETVTKVVKNCPDLEVCDYRNVLIDPSAKGDMRKASFIIYSFETSLSELRKEGIYKNLKHINIENNTPLGDPDHEVDSDSSANFNFNDEARKLLVAYEYWGYWDIDGSGIVQPIVATWVGDTLIRLEANPFPDKKLPFVVARLMPVRNSVYGEPDGELLIEHQKILGAVTRGMIDLMGRSANGQMGIRKDALDTVNMRRFQQGKDYEYNANVDPRMAFYMHTYPEIPASAQYMINLQNMEAESMSGVKAFSQGITSESMGPVAAGIRTAIDAAGKREMSILRRLSSGIVEIGRKIISMNSEWLEDEEIIRITNENFVAIRREDLGGKFDLHVDISTAEEDNVKAQELAFMLQTVGPNVDPGIMKIILRDIARLRKMHELAKEIEEYNPQPDPIQQQSAMLEIEKLKAEIAELYARVKENTTDAELNLAKIDETRAEAGLKQSQTDLNNLDFVEQETGTKQEREKELMGEQARAQGETKILEHELNRETEALSELDKYLQTRRSQEN